MPKHMRRHVLKGLAAGGISVFLPHVSVQGQAPPTQPEPEPEFRGHGWGVGVSEVFWGGIDTIHETIDLLDPDAFYDWSSIMPHPYRDPKWVPMSYSFKTTWNPNQYNQNRTLLVNNEPESGSNNHDAYDYREHELAMRHLAQIRERNPKVTLVAHNTNINGRNLAWTEESIRRMNAADPDNTMNTAIGIHLYRPETLKDAQRLWNGYLEVWNRVGRNRETYITEWACTKNTPPAEVERCMAFLREKMESKEANLVAVYFFASHPYEDYTPLIDNGRLTVLGEAWLRHK